MTKIIAEKITCWLIKENAITESDKELYEYSVQNFFLTVIPIIMSILIGVLFSSPLNGIFVILPFASVRKFSGGFHAKKEISCLISSSLLLLLCIWLSTQLSDSLIPLLIAGLATVSLITFSPIDNENKALSPDETKEYKRITAIIVLSLILIDLFLHLFHLANVSISISIGLILSSCLQFPCVILRFLKVKTSKKGK